MSSVKIETVKAFTKEEAFAQVADLNPAKIHNGTKKWQKVGEPTIGTKEFKLFAVDFLKSKKASEAYVVLKGGSADTRQNPYKVVSVKTEGKRKFKRFYQIVEAELEVKYGKEVITDEETGVSKEKEVVKSVEVISRGAVAGQFDKKATAEAEMKTLIADTKKDYVIDIVELCIEGEPIASYGIYTPSTSAVEGTFAIITEVE